MAGFSLLEVTQEGMYKLLWRERAVQDFRANTNKKTAKTWTLNTNNQ